MTAKSRPLFAAAWIAFLVSLFLFGVDTMRGWQCAWSCIAVLLDGEWGMIYYILFTIPNLLMVCSPFFIFYLKKRGHPFGWFYGLSIFSVLYVLSFGVLNWVTPGFALKSGYYLWLISFVGLLAGVIVRRRELVGHPVVAEKLHVAV